MKKLLCLVLCLFVVPFICGCGKKPDTIVVTGTITVDGQPVEEITIVFVPSDANGLAAFGKTDSQGKFRLSTASRPVGSGAKAGEYIPTFSKEELIGDAVAPMPENARAGDMVSMPAPKIVQHIPVKYSNAQTSGFDPVKVEKGKKNEFTFELSTE